jgi:hypothetical protein
MAKTYKHYLGLISRLCGRASLRRLSNNPTLPLMYKAMHLEDGRFE